MRSEVTKGTFSHGSLKKTNPLNIPTGTNIYVHKIEAEVAS